jgi:hypothetical protein
VPNSAIYLFQLIIAQNAFVCFSNRRRREIVYQTAVNKVLLHTPSEKNTADSVRVLLLGRSLRVFGCLMICRGVISAMPVRPKG